MSPSGKLTISILGFLLALVILFQWRPWEPRRHGVRFDECVEAIAVACEHSVALSNVPPEVALAVRAMPEDATKRFSRMLEAPETSWIDKQVDAIEEFGDLKFDRKRRVPEPQIGLVGIGVLGAAAAPVIPQLERMLNSGGADAMSRAVIALHLIGEPAVPALTNAILHTNETVRIAALYALRTVTPRSDVLFDSALHLLTHGTQLDRTKAAQMICSSPSDVERALRIALELLEDPDLSVRRSALYGLRFFGDRQLSLLPGFASQLRSNSVLVEVRDLAGSLGFWTNHPAAAVECLIEGLQNPSEAHRIPMLSSIERLRPPPARILPVIEPLYLNAPTGTYRLALARTLVELAPDAAVRLGISTNLLLPNSPRRGHR